MDWRFVPVEPSDVMRWSFGLVETKADLCGQRIFGPLRDSACECGKYSGDQHHGIICDVCGGKMTQGSAALRRSRLGHIELATPCQHPLGSRSEMLSHFPIAPIAYRMRDEATPSALGKKYEELIDANQAILESLLQKGAKGTSEFYLAIKDVDKAPLQTAIEAIIGTPGAVRSQGSASDEEPDTLFGALFQAISRLDESASSIVRSMGCALELCGRA